MSSILNKLVSLLLLFLSIGYNTACQNDEGSHRFPGLEQEIESLMEEFHAAGLAVGVLENGSLTYSNPFGYRDVEKKLPVDINTLFGIGSVTKAFTAATLGIMEEKRLLSLSDRPQEYIKELRFNNQEMDAEIEISHLLSHSSGVGTMTSESSCILFLSKDRNAVIPRIEHWAPAARGGESFRYNNFMYTLAGIVGERVTSNTWEENVHDLLLQPLEMDHTRVGYRSAKRAKNFAYGYSVLGAQPHRVLPETIMTRSPGGDIYSSITDMAKWLNVWLKGGKLGKQQFLPEKYLGEATSGQQPMTSAGQEDSGSPSYGYGWMISDFHGRKRVEHSGAISGYSSNVVLFPDQQLGIVVLSNQSNSSLPNVVTRLLVDRLMDVERDSADRAAIRFGQIRPLEKADIKTEINTEDKPSHELKSFSGQYNHAGFGTIEVSCVKGTLLATFPFTTFRLVHETGNNFSSAFTEEIPQIMGPWLTFTFRVDSEGQVDAVIVNLGEEPVPFSRKKE
ncbi:MAG: serine hydrolase [Cyanothece sp. SIO1E1]|nr:serine hydrolase [Cyanothece sp. SIO1E1]